VTADRLQDVKAWMERLDALEPDLSSILRRAQGPRRRARIGVATLTAGLLLAVVVPLWALVALAPGGRNRPDARTEPADGGAALAFKVPEAWDTRTYETRDGTVTVFEFATFPLAGAPNTLNGVRRLMSPDDVFIHVADWTEVCPCEGFSGVQLPLSFGPADFQHQVVGRDMWNLKPLSSPHAWIGRTWNIEGRSLAVFVDMASPSARLQSIEAANAVLQSLEITQPGAAPAPVGDCPAIGPWSDPDCAQSRWVRVVIDEAGLSLVGDTGSALVVKSQSERFHVWTTSADEPLSTILGTQGYSEFKTIEDTTVYFDGVRYVWTADQLNVWVASASDAHVPEAALLQLVSASTRVEFETNS
jgi:hypothetical protein